MMYRLNNVPAGFCGWIVVNVGGSLEPDKGSEDSEEGFEGSVALVGVPSMMCVMASSSSRLGLRGSR